MSPKKIPVGAKRRSTLDPREVGEKIGVPVETWHGRCHEIAGLMLAAGLVDGKLRYGMWLGPCDPEGHFAGRTLSHHGWIERERAKRCMGCGRPFRIDGPCCELNKSSPAVVIDPTRWVFENTKPYIFEGHDCEGFYDVAGDVLRRAFARPYPKEPEPWEVARSTPAPDVTLEMEPPHPLHTAILIHENGGDPVQLERGRKITLPARGIAWLANCPLSMLGDLAGPLYEALYKAGQEALIPIDNREAVKGDGWYGQKKAYDERVRRAKRPKKE
jgi:hypothetical protein